MVAVSFDSMILSFGVSGRLSGYNGVCSPLVNITSVFKTLYIRGFVVSFLLLEKLIWYISISTIELLV